MTLSMILLQAVAVILIAIFMVWSLFRENKHVPINNDWLPALQKLPTKLNLGIRVFITFGTMFAVADIAWVAEPLAQNLFLRLLVSFGIQVSQFVIGISVIVFGVGAFLFKLQSQFWYGIVEIIFAGAGGIFIARQLTPGGQHTAPILALITSVYIVSRGLGNVTEAWQRKMSKTAN